MIKTETENYDEILTNALDKEGLFHEYCVFEFDYGLMTFKGHKIFARERRKFLGIPYKKELIVANITSEAECAKHIHQRDNCPYKEHLEYNGLEIFVWSENIKKKIESVAKKLKEELSENVKISFA